jgi:hypothetical protein
MVMLAIKQTTMLLKDPMIKWNTPSKLSKAACLQLMVTTTPQSFD